MQQSTENYLAQFKKKQKYQSPKTQRRKRLKKLSLDGLVGNPLDALFEVIKRFHFLTPSQTEYKMKSLSDIFVV